MTSKEIIDVLSSKKRGQMIRVSWVSSVPVIKEYKNSVVIEKVTTSTVRFGCKYSNLKSTIQHRAESQSNQSREYKAWWNWVVPNIIKKHNDTSQEYLTLYPLPRGGNYHIQYWMNGEAVTLEQIECYIKPSTNKSTTIFDVKVENVINIK